jgi:uroporphyrinogen-III synthase
MVKNGAISGTAGKNVKKILITQPKPENDRSPYFELAKSII